MAHSNLIQSVLRGLDILLEVGRVDNGVTLRELGVRLNLKTPTLHNLVRTLKARGFIRQCPGQARYILGPTLFNLTSLHRESCLMTEAEKTVHFLFDEMQQMATITFAEQIGSEMQIVLRMSSDQPVIMQKPWRQILDAYTSATALILHAFGADEDREAVQERHPFQECAGPFANDLGQFNELLKQIRKQGYAFNPIHYPDRIAMAAPVLGTTNELLGIIGLSRRNLAGEHEKESVQQMALNRLLTAAQNISKAWVSLTENCPART